MKFTWMLLMTILMVASSVRSNFPTVIPEPIKKDHLVVMASEVPIRLYYIKINFLKISVK
jgi:hypothetical protein